MSFRRGDRLEKRCTVSRVSCWTLPVTADGRRHSGAKSKNPFLALQACKSRDFYDSLELLILRLPGQCSRGRSRCLPYPLHGKDVLKGRVKFSSHIGMIPGLLLAAYPSPHLCTHCHPLDFLRQLGLHLKLESLQRYAASWPTGSGHYPSIGLKLVSAGPVPARRKPAAASWFDRPGPGQAAGLGRARSRAAGPVCCKPSAASDSSCLVRGSQEARLRRVPSTAWCLQGAAHLRDPS